MSEKFLSNINALKAALITEDEAEMYADKIGLLARALRWYPEPDQEDLAALVALGESILGQRGNGCWEVERAVFETLSNHATAENLPFLINAYEFRSTHAEDRRRLAMQGLSRVAALTGNETALDTLVSALSHNRADTRGWAIGFLAEAFFALGRPIPATIQTRFRWLAENDPSEDVRAEAEQVIKSTHV